MEFMNALHDISTFMHQKLSRTKTECNNQLQSDNGITI